jgi:hypothetical protein
MIIPNILALDFDGVLCDGMQDYFEASRRSYMSVWPDETVPGEDLLPVFRTLRPVIMTGWEMPLLLRAIVQGRPQSAILQNWEAVCEGLVNAGRLHGDALVSLLQRTLDDVRREWIAADRHDWLERTTPYCALEEVRRLVAEPERAVLVTTKEGEFARQILDHWGCDWPTSRARRLESTSVRTSAPSSPTIRRRMGGVRGYGSSKTGSTPSNTSPPMPIWRTWRCSWRLGATARRRCARRCGATGGSACSNWISSGEA